MKTAYNLSKEITEVRLNKFNKLTSNRLLNCNSDNNKVREQLAQDLITYLCKKFKINVAQVVVTNKPRKQCHNAQTYGYYLVQSQVITIYNTTAKKYEPVAIKTFFNTLLHEFMHHYDYEVLKLDNSLHTGGFHKRITDIKNKLV